MTFIYFGTDGCKRTAG